MTKTTNTMKTNSIEESFWLYHRQNPDVYKYFERFALHLLRDKKMKKIGAKMIMERVRWEVYIERRDEYKINNNYTSQYARLFVRNHPEFYDRFEFRKIKNNNPVQLTFC